MRTLTKLLALAAPLCVLYVLTLTTNETNAPIARPEPTAKPSHGPSGVVSMDVPRPPPSKQPEKLFAMYGGRRNIVVRPLSGIDWKSWSPENPPLPPKDLQWSLPPKDKPFALPYTPDVSNPETFKRSVSSAADALGMTEAVRKGLGPKERLDLVVKLVSERVHYAYVDDPPYRKLHPGKLGCDDFWMLGEGDCDKYADLVVLLWVMFDTEKPLKNVFVRTDNDSWPLFRRRIRHAWNKIIVLLPTHAEVAFFDVTFADNGGQLEGREGTHWDADSFHFNLAQEVMDDEEQADILEERLASTLDTKTRLPLLKEFSSNGHVQKNEKQFLLVADEFERLGGQFSRSTLVHRAEIACKHGDVQAAKRDWDQLLRRHEEKDFLGVTTVPSCLK